MSMMTLMHWLLIVSSQKHRMYGPWTWILGTNLATEDGHLIMTSIKSHQYLTPNLAILLRAVLLAFLLIWIEALLAFLRMVMIWAKHSWIQSSKRATSTLSSRQTANVKFQFSTQMYTPNIEPQFPSQAIQVQTLVLICMINKNPALEGKKASLIKWWMERIKCLMGLPMETGRILTQISWMIRRAFFSKLPTLFSATHPQNTEKN